MPELPEVETVVRGLRPKLCGHRIDAVWSSGLALRGLRTFDAARARRLLAGRRIVAVERRAKYILIRLDEPPAAGLLVHLGMTGSLRVHLAREPRLRHTHVVCTLDDGRELRFVDPRRFGCVHAEAHLDELAALAHLGPDPLAELDEGRLRALLAASRAPLKAFLLDQRRIAGIGNIYACEALHRARLHPALPARRALARSADLLAGIRTALQSAVDLRGTTFRDFVDDAGERGGAAISLLVYGREGEPCRTCGTTIKRMVQAGRSTFYCPRCQRARGSFTPAAASGGRARASSGGPRAAGIRSSSGTRA